MRDACLRIKDCPYEALRTVWVYGVEVAGRSFHQQARSWVASFAMLVEARCFRQLGKSSWVRSWGKEMQQGWQPLLHVPVAIVEQLSHALELAHA